MAMRASINVAPSCLFARAEPKRTAEKRNGAITDAHQMGLQKTKRLNADGRSKTAWRQSPTTATDPPAYTVTVAGAPAALTEENCAVPSNVLEARPVGA